MAQSMSVQSLSMEKRIEFQDKMLGLGPAEMRKVIQILKNESKELAELKKRSSRDEKEIKKMAAMAQSLKSSGRTLDKVFLNAQESSDREQSSKITESLLDKIGEL